MARLSIIIVLVSWLPAWAWALSDGGRPSDSEHEAPEYIRLLQEDPESETPSNEPSLFPSYEESDFPSLEPSLEPTQLEDTEQPTTLTPNPASQAGVTTMPTNFPSTSPSTRAPTDLPTTAAPTTASPTTATPTTRAPTDLPTTAAPTTASPTTAAPTTLAPTEMPSGAPTTISPTTAAPTTNPTTGAPTRMFDILIETRGDFFNQETSWALTNLAGTELLAGGVERFSIQQHVVSVPSGVYCFKINDTFGDGICCNYGFGFYAVVANNVNVFFGGDEYECTTGRRCLEIDPDGKVSLFDSDFDPSKFNIFLDLDGSSVPATSTMNWAEPFWKAKERWETIITSDLGFITRTRFVGGSCAEYGPLMPERVDDIYIRAKVAPIDGPKGVLGFASVSVLQIGSNSLGEVVRAIPVVGYTEFDLADLEILMVNGTLSSVVLHEFAHLLGINSLVWQRVGLYNFSQVNAEYTGIYATEEYQRISGRNNTVPIETNGGPGTRFSHFDEECLGKELLTGFTNGTAGILSSITIGALKDIGYEVDFGQAENFTIPENATCVNRSPVDPQRNLRGSNKPIDPFQRLRYHSRPLTGNARSARPLSRETLEGTLHFWLKRLRNMQQNEHELPKTKPKPQNKEDSDLEFVSYTSVFVMESDGVIHEVGISDEPGVP